MKQHLLGILLAVAVCFGANLPAQAQNTKDIVDRLETALGVSLPSPYRAKFKEFVATNKIMRDEGSNAFTEKFIKDQMKTNLGINRRNQFLLVWNAIYHAIKDDYVYDGSNGNKAILDDYVKVWNAIEACEEKYRKDYIAYTKRRSAEAERRSAEADRRIAEAKKKLVELERGIDAIKRNIRNEASIGFNYINEFYYLYNANLDIVKDKDIQKNLDKMKSVVRDIVKVCKENNIDYKSKLSYEVRKFFGVE